MSVRLRVTGVIASLAILTAFSVSAATIEVNTTVDVVNATDGLCSLREAVTAHNSQSRSGKKNGECSAGSLLQDTINLPGAGPYTLTIAGVADDANLSGDLDIDSAQGAKLSIVGLGTKAVIDANGIDRVFDIKDQSAIVEFRNLTIRGGFPDGGFAPGHGGGISTKVPLSLVDVIVEDNIAFGEGGGIYAVTETPFNSWQVDLTNSVVQNNSAGIRGGGISVNWSFHSKNSTISGNEAPLGGGISGVGPGDGITLVQSTVSDNSGGGINAQSVQTFLIASTVSGNTAVTGSAINKGGAENLYLANSTISGNQSTDEFAGGAILVQGSGALTSVNTTIADNKLPEDAPDTSVINNVTGIIFVNTIVEGTCGGSVLPTGGAGNLESPGDTCAFGAGNQVNVTAEELMLGALASNGGPTMTHLPTADSVAVDTAEDASCPSLDQRGLGRPGGESCDVGSVEVAGCEGVQIIHLQGQTIDTTETFTACSAIILGSDLTLASPADVTLESNNVVSFRENVSVESGATLSVNTVTPPLEPLDLQNVLEVIKAAERLR